MNIYQEVSPTMLTFCTISSKPFCSPLYMQNSQHNTGQPHKFEHRFIISCCIHQKVCATMLIVCSLYHLLKTNLFSPLHVEQLAHYWVYYSLLHHHNKLDASKQPFGNNIPLKSTSTLQLFVSVIHIKFSKPTITLITQQL